MSKMIMPKTERPKNTIPILIVLVVVLGLILFYFLKIWGVVLLVGGLALSTNLFTNGIPAFNAGILINLINGKMRVIFPGINWKLPWEKESQLIDVRVELKEVLKETYPSQDAKMEVEYIYTIRPNISNKHGMDPVTAILLYSSFEPEAIKAKGKGLFSMMISDHYGKNTSNNLLDKSSINNELFEKDDSCKIKEFEEKHGCEIHVLIKDSDPVKEAQKFRDMVSGAKSINLAIKELIDGGMSKEEAERMVKLMNLENYSENDFNLNVDAPDLRNLQNMTFMGGGSRSFGNKSTKGGGTKK